MKTAEEEWRAVVGWEGFYEVSNLGRVRSLERVVTRSNGYPLPVKAKVLSPSPDTRGHMQVALREPHRTRVARVHRLVLESFVGPCPEGGEGLHWDDDKENNNLSNLRWGTRTENLLDRVRNGRHSFAARNHCSRGHEYTPENVYKKPGKNARLCRICRKTEPWRDAQ